MVQPPKKILAIANPFARHQLAMQRAAALGEACGAQVVAHALVHDPEYDDGIFNWDEKNDAQERDKRVNDVQSWLKEQASSLPASIAEVGARWGHPFDDAVIALIQDIRPDLVVVQPRADAAQRLSRTEWSLLQKCPTPIWLARKEQWPEHPTILAAIDPTHAHDKPASLDRQIIRTAAAIGPALNGDVHVFHALGEIPSGIGIAQSPQKYEEELRKLRTDAVQELLQEEATGQTTIHLPTRAPGHGLEIHCKSHSVDVLVIGLLARSRLGDLLIGSTARDIVPRSDCDLLFMKPGI